jgi:AcrR family transcriptional regulator
MDRMAVPISPRRGRPKASSRSEVETTAVRLFTEHGYEETTLEMICAASGVSKSTFFRYFTGKSEVLWYVFDKHVQSLHDRLEEAALGSTTMETLHDVLIVNARVHMGYNTSWSQRFRIYDTVPTLRAEAAGRWENYRKVISDFVAVREGLDTRSIIPAAIAGAVQSMFVSELRLAVARGSSIEEFLVALGEGSIPVCNAMQKVLDASRASHVPWAAGRGRNNPQVLVWE